MHVTESTPLGSSDNVEIKEEVLDEEESSSTAATTSNAITTSTTVSPGTEHLTDASSPKSVTDSTSPSRDSAAATSETVLAVNGFKVEPVNNANTSDSAVETDDSSQDDLLIAAEDVKLEEVDSDCEDTVDGRPLLQHLREIEFKVEHDTNSNSSCSLSSFSNAFLNGESDASMRKRLFTSLSQSFPGSALSRVLHSMDTMPLDSEDEELPAPERLSSSCFGMIRMEKGAIEDDELTSLAWLQDSDLLKNINAGEDDAPAGEEQKENADGQKNGEGGGGGFVPQTHPPHVPYNPQKHVNAKPPYSFSCLIFMAVEESPEKKLPVKDIYNWIQSHFPYFQNAPTGWKNSVRHNLSLNKCFKKVEKDKGTSIGKGSLWCIDPDYRPNLLQMLRKTPYHPYHQLQMMSTLQPQQQIHHVQGVPASGFRPMPLTQRAVPNTVSPHLFPFLSRRLAQTGFEYFDREMQDVANTLVAMKGSNSKNSSGLSSDGSDASGPTRSMLKRGHNGVFKHRGPVIWTPPPHEDHSYTSYKDDEEDAASGTSSIDNEYDFGGEDDDDISEPSDYPSDWDCVSDGDEVDGDIPAVAQRKRLRINLVKKEDKDEEEKQEGAKLLLSLAGVASFSGDEEEKHTPNTSSSSTSNKTSSSLSKSTGSSSASSKDQSSNKASSSATGSKSSSSLSSSQSSSSSRASTSRSSPRTPSSSKASTKTFQQSPKSSVTASSSSSKSSVTSSLSRSTVTASSPSTKTVSSPAPVAKSSPSSTTSSTKSSIIMTRRGKAAAEAAAAAAAPGMCTRGKKLSAS